MEGSSFPGTIKPAPGKVSDFSMDRWIAFCFHDGIPGITGSNMML
jgi:hypothetical protein